MASLPTGTITFLFTDIEGSTKLWDAHSAVMQPAMERHDALLQAAFAGNNGFVFKTVGDAFCAAFASAPDALEAALAAQSALLAEPWPEQTPLKVRMALHTGIAQERDGDYFGPVLNRVARLLSAGHGGQTLVSASTYELVRDHVSDGAALLDLGSHRLKDLERPEHVYQVNAPNLSDTFAPLKTLDTTPNNLPPQLTSFIGREKVLADMTALLAKTRLLTLTGSGGSGKSRLSLQVAADALDNYADGAWLVELAPLSDAALVPQTVAQVLEVKEAVGQSIAQTLTNYLKDKTLLLILDNCEHLVSACAQVTAALLRSCPNVKVLATSREPLGIAGEQTYRVPSLTLPDPQEGKKATADSLSQFEAVRLFIERGQAVKLDFAVTNQNAPALAQICYRLGGIPLAIELAAARVRSLSVEQINDKLDTRFRVLTGGDKAALPRQQTLRALVDWSYDLLTDTEKTLFARLSVFAGGWTLDAAEVVCRFDPIEDWEVLDLLTSLVDKSLVAVEAEEEGIQSRYRMLETLRQYGTEKQQAFGETETLQNRHADFFLEFAEKAFPFLTQGTEQKAWLNRLEREHDNVRAAIDACATGASAGDAEASEKQLRLTGLMWQFWYTRGYITEARERLARAQTCVIGPSAESLDKARVLYAGGLMAQFQGDYAAARSLFEAGIALYRRLEHEDSGFAMNQLASLAWVQGKPDEARELLEGAFAQFERSGNKKGMADSLAQLGNGAYNRQEYDAAQNCHGRALALRRELKILHLVASSLHNLGNVAFCRNDYARAEALYEESLAIKREIGDISITAVTLEGLGFVALSQGDYVTAQARHEEALAIRRELGEKAGVADSLNRLACLAGTQNDHEQAQILFRESLTLYREMGNKPGVVRSLGDLAEYFFHISQFQKAVTLFEATAILRQEAGYGMPPASQAEIDEMESRVRAVLGDEAYDAARQAGRALNMDAAIALALA